MQDLQCLRTVWDSLYQTESATSFQKLICLNMCIGNISNIHPCIWGIGKCLSSCNKQISTRFEVEASIGHWTLVCNLLVDNLLFSIHFLGTLLSSDTEKILPEAIKFRHYIFSSIIYLILCRYTSIRFFSLFWQLLMIIIIYFGWYFMKQRGGYWDEARFTLHVGWSWFNIEMKHVLIFR